jgi:hypothetical protein
MAEQHADMAVSLMNRSAKRMNWIEGFGMIPVSINDIKSLKVDNSEEVTATSNIGSLASLIPTQRWSDRRQVTRVEEEGGDTYQKSALL